MIWEINLQNEPPKDVQQIELLLCFYGNEENHLEVNCKRFTGSDCKNRTEKK